MDKGDNFKRLAEKRVNKAISMLRLIGNLSNKALYKFGDNEVKQILEALNAEIADIKTKFKSKSSDRDGNGFKLK